MHLQMMIPSAQLLRTTSLWIVTTWSCFVVSLLILNGVATLLGVCVNHAGFCCVRAWSCVRMLATPMARDI
jgi:hypothetical protein